MTDKSYSLICTTREENLKKARELINSFELSYLQERSEGYDLLRDAIKKKQTAIIKLLLTNGFKVNSKNKKLSNTPLHFAAINGDIEIVKMLLDRSANINAKNKNGRTPLYNAIENEKLEMTELLLTRGAYINAKDNNDITPLHLAAKKRVTKFYKDAQSLAVEKRHETIKMLLDKGANIDAKDEYGRTPLYNAIENEKMEIIELLLNRGANVNAKNNRGITPLHIAAERGYLQIVKHLLKLGAHANCTSKIGYTPLYLGVREGHEKVVKLLLECGANVDDQDNDGKTILHFAVEKGHLEIIEHILKYCPDINNKSNRSSLNTAVYGYETTVYDYDYEEKYSKIVEILLQYGFTVNPEDINNCELLHAAVKKGYLRIVKEFLKYGTDVNMLYYSTSGNSYTPLHTAIKNNQEEVAKLLISYKADVNAKDETGKTPIFYVTESTDLKIIKLLLTNRASIKYNNPNLLNIAITEECREIVEILLQHGVDINASDNNGRTALYCTSLSNIERCIGFIFNENSDINVKGGYHVRAEIAKLLLSRGANVNAKQKNGMTALHIATKKGHKKVVEVLLNYGAEVDSKVEITNITPFHIAAQKDYLEIVEVLLKFGADINSRDKYGRTALHMASKEGCIQTVIALLKHGSDINIINNNYYTPLDVALTGFNRYSIRACEEIAEILKQHIVKIKTANLYVSKKNLLRMSSHYKIKDFQNKCEKEIAIMKSEKISNTNISFYDILTKDTNLLARYMRNENIVQVLKSDDYKTKFPIYASMVENQFRKGMKKKELLEQGNKTFNFLFNNFPELPHHCIEKIFSYLSDKDLKILIDTCKPPSVSDPNIDITDVAITSNISKVSCV